MKATELNRTNPADPSWNDAEILVVGAGTMGASLAQTYAQNGFTVGMLDVSSDCLGRGFDAIDRELERAKGKIFSPAETGAIRRRILGTTDYPEACRSKALRLVIEAATERIDLKREIFKCLDSLCAPPVVLASNSSSLDVNVLAGATKRPEKVVWTHYFYLPHKNRAAEYAGTDTASEESKETARRYLKLGGKIPTHIRGSRKGGVADIVFVALLLEATRMAEEGFGIRTIEEAGKRAYGIPIGFLELMDATGLPVGLFSMRSFSDASDPSDPLYRVYGNFFTPRQNYIALLDRYQKADDPSAIRWVPEGMRAADIEDPKSLEALTDRFLAVGFLTATECVDAGLISIEDLELLAQNAFLWNKGPFTLMNQLGMKKVSAVIAARAELARSFKQDFPVSGLLRKQMGTPDPWSFFISPVRSDTESGGAVRRITLSNPKASNAMDDAVFEELKRQFGNANDDARCKAIIFDTAPIKTFIAGANVPSFIERIKAKKFNAIVQSTREWQRILFHVMTGTSKPKIAIVDGQSFGGGVEVACAFALDPNSIVLATGRTSFSLPETRLGIYPGLRGTLTLAQIIANATKDNEAGLALARYYILAGGVQTSSAQAACRLGLADVLVPQHRRDEAAAAIARAIVENDGTMISRAGLDSLNFERLDGRLSLSEETELQIARELFSQADLIPTLYAQARGQLPLWYTGEMKATAERMARRVAAASPNAVRVSDELISRGFSGYLQGIDNDTLAGFELEHALQNVFEHPDALIGLQAMVDGTFPAFRRRYPF